MFDTVNHLTLPLPLTSWHLWHYIYHLAPDTVTPLTLPMPLRACSETVNPLGRGSRWCFRWGSPFSLATFRHTLCFSSVKRVPSQSKTNWKRNVLPLKNESHTHTHTHKYFPKHKCLKKTKSYLIFFSSRRHRRWDRGSYGFYLRFFWPLLLPITL